LIWVRKFGL